MREGDRRIRTFILFRAVTSFSLWLPFWTIWVYSNLQDFFLMTAVDTAFWITMVVFQIPAGLLGDRYGRKRMLLVGEVLYSVGILAFGFSTGFFEFIAANIVWALGVCFIVSGDTPFLYDTLVELNRQAEFTAVMGKCNAVMYMMNAAAAVVGGVIVQLTDHLEYTLIIASVIGLFGTSTALMLKEPRVTGREHLASYTRHLKSGMRTVLASRAIMALILIQIIIEIGVYVMAVFRGVYMDEHLDFDYLQIGLFFAGFSVVGGLVVRNAGRIEGHLGERRSLVFMYLAIVFSFAIVFLVASPIVIIVQFLIYSVSSLQGPIISGYLNKRVDSQHRSTVVAIATFMFTGILTVVELGAGWLGEQIGLVESLAILAVASAPFMVYLLYIWDVEARKDTASKRKLMRVLKSM